MSKSEFTPVFKAARLVMRESKKHGKSPREYLEMCLKDPENNGASKGMQNAIRVLEGFAANVVHLGASMADLLDAAMDVMQSAKATGVSPEHIISEAAKELSGTCQMC